MVSSSLKDNSTMSNYPRALNSIIISVGLLAVFITLASWILLSHPFGNVVQSYFNDVKDVGSDSGSNDVVVSGKPDLSVSFENDSTLQEGGVHETVGIGSNDVVSRKSDLSGSFGNGSTLQEGGDKKSVRIESNDVVSREPGISVASDSILQKGGNENAVQSDVASQNKDFSMSSVKDGSLKDGIENPVQIRNKQSVNVGSDDAVSAGLSDSGISDTNARKKSSVESECDLFRGEWFYDSSGPVYTNNTCPVITQMQNCQGNGRPDKEYESWRWKPAQCELPRFNGTKFLELMSGKTLAFVGDSVARNQMESLLCLLWQVEAPKNRGNRHMQRWFFRSKSVMIVRIWSSWLVHQTSEPSGDVPQGVAQLHLDIPDETFMQYIPDFDVVVLSSGHWFAKQSVYLLNNEIVGTQLWSPPNKQPMKINNVDAFGISVETCMAAMATHPNYTGLTILRSYSPDHYEGGAWNTGGSCTGKVRPILPGQLVENGFTNTMHEKQVTGFNQGVKKQTNGSKSKLLDITDVFSYRHDGHPGPYRSPDPNKITKRGPDGKPPPQDCLHWCMPGPVDTWNELVLEIIRREFEGDQKPAS
ncbi:hypothetical protein RND81_14G124500 [Saponaria officinalis]|uniref:Trichome birefringence-like N-terminal domain-containing protein n=1 Tax=Saponaria officinalis TaxID=3572 RepID=A0AAW1GLA6_SAPOF